VQRDCALQTLTGGLQQHHPLFHAQHGHWEEGFAAFNAAAAKAGQQDAEKRSQELSDAESLSSHRLSQGQKRASHYRL
jgi:hypothetical protein